MCSPITRGVVVDWYLKELGADATNVETVVLDYKAKDHKKEDYLKVSAVQQ